MDEDERAWHEAPSVTITRLVCQLVLALVVMFAAGLILLTHPEHSGSASLLIGIVLGSWFGISRSPVRALRRRNEGD
jgi:hypothetical protein